MNGQIEAVSLNLKSILELPQVMEIQVFTGNTDTGNREQVIFQIRFPLIPDKNNYSTIYNYTFYSSRYRPYQLYDLIGNW